MQQLIPGSGFGDANLLEENNPKVW